MALAPSLYGNTMGDRRRALTIARMTIETAPRLWGGWLEAGMASQDLAHEEDALKYLQALLKVRPQDQWRNHRLSMPYIFRGARMRIDRMRDDFQRLRHDGRTVVPNDSEDTSARLLLEAEASAGEHDCDAAADYLLRAEAVEAGPARTCGFIRRTQPAEAAIRQRLAACRGDWQAGLAAAQGAVTDRELAIAKSSPNRASRFQAKLQSSELPALALMRGMTGDLAGAEAVIAATPLDCYLCLRVRGQLAALAHDWPAADRWFAEAVRQAPSLPAAYAEWGETRLTRGDIDGAIAKFALAHDRGPRFADPLKAWGDALSREGRWSEATDKYDQALRLAPAWRDLIHARAAAGTKL